MLAFILREEAAVNLWWAEKYRELTEAVEALKRLAQGVSVVDQSRTYRNLESLQPSIELLRSLAAE